MQVTQTTRLARQHMKTTNKGSTIFNDRLVDGRRSLKVWGWSLPQYESFQRVLKQAGLNSVIISGPRLSPWARAGDLQYRIHVDEVI